MIAINECTPVLDRRRRIDRILLHENFQNSVAERYARIVASSDHKAVIASLSAKPTKQGKRLRIRTTFFSSEENLQQLQTELHSIDTEGYSKWADGLECIKTAAFSYEKANRATGVTELQSLLMVSSTHHLSEEAWRYLKEHGYTPSSAKAAYQITSKRVVSLLSYRAAALQKPARLAPWVSLGAGMGKSPMDYWPLVIQGGSSPETRATCPLGESGGWNGQKPHGLLLLNMISSKRVVRSSAGAYAIYPPFLGVIRVPYPKVWYRMSNPL